MSLRIHLNFIFAVNSFNLGTMPRLAATPHPHLQRLPHRRRKEQYRVRTMAIVGKLKGIKFGLATSNRQRQSFTLSGHNRTSSAIVRSSFLSRAAKRFLVVTFFDSDHRTAVAFTGFSVNRVTAQRQQHDMGCLLLRRHQASPGRPLKI